MNLRRSLPLAIVLTLTGTMAFAAAAVGDAVPSFEATTLDGQLISTNNLKDKSPMLIVFWASWCPHCVRDVEKLNELYTAYRSKGLVVVAINPGVNDSVSRIEQFVKSHSVAYPVAFDGTSNMRKEFGIFGVPTYFVVDKSGIVQYRGSLLPDSLEKVL